MRKEEFEQLKKELSLLNSMLSNLNRLIQEFLLRPDKNLDAFMGWAQAYVNAYLPGREGIFDGQLYFKDDIRHLFAAAVQLAATRFYEIKELREEIDRSRREINTLKEGNRETKTEHRTN